MSPAVRVEGLAAAARVAREELLALAEALACERAIVVEEPPEARSLMLEHASAIGSFCLGEVIVTTATVTVGEARGWSCVLGFDEKAALAAAICDACGSRQVDELALSALAVEKAAQMRNHAAVRETRVSLR